MFQFEIYKHFQASSPDFKYLSPSLTLTLTVTLHDSALSRDIPGFDEFNIYFQQNSTKRSSQLPRHLLLSAHPAFNAKAKTFVADKWRKHWVTMSKVVLVFTWETVYETQKHSFARVTKFTEKNLMGILVAWVAIRVEYL